MTKDKRISLKWELKINILTHLEYVLPVPIFSSLENGKNDIMINTRIIINYIVQIILKQIISPLTNSTIDILIFQDHLLRGIILHHFKNQIIQLFNNQVTLPFKNIQNPL